MNEVTSLKKSPLSNDESWTAHLQHFARSIDAARARLEDAVFVHAVLEGGPLDYNRDYLDYLPENLRQEYNCNACRKFFRKFGNLAYIDNDGDLVPVFFRGGFAPDGMQTAYGHIVGRFAGATPGQHYQTRRYFGHVTPTVVGGIHYGDPSTPSEGGVAYHHWHFQETSPIGKMQADQYQLTQRNVEHEFQQALKAQDYPVLSIANLDEEAFDQFMLPYAGEGSEYANFKEMLLSVKNTAVLARRFVRIRSHMEKDATISTYRREMNLAYRHLLRSPVFIHHPNTAIWDLAMVFVHDAQSHLSEGETLEEVQQIELEKFLRRTDPVLYKRATTLAKQQQVDRAVDVIRATGYWDSLKVSFLETPVTERACLLWKPTDPQEKQEAVEETNPFAKLQEAVSSKKEELGKPVIPHRAVSMYYFLEKILPKAQMLHFDRSIAQSSLTHNAFQFLGIGVCTPVDQPNIWQSKGEAAWQLRVHLSGMVTNFDWQFKPINPNHMLIGIRVAQVTISANNTLPDDMSLSEKLERDDAAVAFHVPEVEFTQRKGLKPTIFPPALVPALQSHRQVLENMIGLNGWEGVDRVPDLGSNGTEVILTPNVLPMLDLYVEMHDRILQLRIGTWF